MPVIFAPVTRAEGAADIVRSVNIRMSKIYSLYFEVVREPDAVRGTPLPVLPSECSNARARAKPM